MNWILGHQFLILGGAMIAGFGMLAWLVMEMRARLARVFGGARSSGDVITNLLQRMMHAEAKLEAMEPRLVAVEEIARVSIQKIGFLRFNPFQDTGGDNSFIIVLLDAENNGFILSSLYMREATRLYAKAVSGGSVRQPLTDEEQKVLEETLHKN